MDESQQIDTRAEIEADNGGRNTMNNIKNQGRGELYVNGNSIKTIKFIRPAGNSM